MSIRIKHCLTIYCDGCGKGPEDFNDEGWTPHYDSVADAVAALVDESDQDFSYGWLMSATEHVCPRCRAKRACAVVGHEWGDWWTGDARGIPMKRRACWRCNEQEIALAEGAP